MRSQGKKTTKSVLCVSTPGSNGRTARTAPGKKGSIKMQTDLQRQRPAHSCAGHVEEFYFDSKVIGKSFKENAMFVFQRDLMY